MHGAAVARIEEKRCASTLAPMDTDVTFPMTDAHTHAPQDERNDQIAGRQSPARRSGVPGEEEIFAGLTAPQQEAVRCTEGPLLVLAGPGSGKTRVITRRIAYLIACGIPAYQILAVTFTNKAAAEMRERVVKLLGDGPVSRGLTVTTFHALCARLIRKYADVAKLPGITGTFAIFDSDDQTALVKKAIEQAGVTTSNWPARSVLSKISAAKNDLLGPEEYAAQAFDFSGRTIAKIYALYQKGLRASNAVDFDDLLLLTALMLKNNTRVREMCRERWQYLLVDEYQDTNTAQFQIAALLAGGLGTPPVPGGSEYEEAAGDRRGTQTQNICVVGDPDQSIYGWRGADIENILQFEKHFPKAKTIALGENFRSTKHIIGVADTLIRNNKKRKHKDLFTSNAQGVKPEVVICRDEHHEARLVVDWMKERREESMAEGEPLAWKDFAVFYRTNALSRVVEDVLRNEAIPYVIARGTAFYQREEIKHALAYLRVVANPADGISLLRIVNTPSRGIGDTTIERVEELAAQHGTGVLEALRIAPDSLNLVTRTAGSIRKFVSMMDSWAGIHDEGMLHAPAAEGSLAELVERVIRESGLEDMYKKMGEEEAERLENLAELVSSAREYEVNYDPMNDPGADPMTAPLNPDEQPQREPTLLELLRGYLERVTLVADADSVDPAQGSVTMMTLHAAKGLEFAGVAMIGLEEGLLPHSRVMDNPSELEEERRLCFVGITRAMKRLVITSARYRTIRGVTERTIESRFIHELPKQHVTISDQAGFSESGWDTPSGKIGASDGTEGPRFVPDGPSGGKTKVSGPKDSRGVPLVVGANVRHPQFGLGRIVNITSGQDARAQIQFRQAGTKTLVLQYARLERAD